MPSPCFQRSLRIQKTRSPNTSTEAPQRISIIPKNKLPLFDIRMLATNQKEHPNAQVAKLATWCHSLPKESMLLLCSSSFLFALFQLKATTTVVFIVARLKLPPKRMSVDKMWTSGIVSFKKNLKLVGPN
jgi:hypothetical protein